VGEEAQAGTSDKAAAEAPEEIRAIRAKTDER
jgi:hypothetical protein